MGTGEKRGRRNNTDPDSTHREILQAALEVLAKDGPESLSVTEVARRAGVNRGTAYQHFPTREDLLHATADWVSQRMYDELYGDFEELSEREGVYPAELALDRLSRFAMDNPELSRAWWYDVMTTEGEVTDRFWAEYVERLQDYVDQGFGRADVDVEVLAFITLVSSFLWPIWVGAHTRGSRSRKEMRQRFFDEMMRLVLFGSLVPEHHAELIERYGAKPRKNR
jgi:AcrR family transcriptional regulator